MRERKGEKEGDNRRVVETMAIISEASGKVETDTVFGEVALPEESVLDELVAEGAVGHDPLSGVLLGESAGRCCELGGERTG